MTEKSLRETDYWRYAFNKYAGSIRSAPAEIRRSWAVSAVQSNANEFANKVIKAHGNKKPVIKFDKMGVPIIKNKEFNW